MSQIVINIDTEKKTLVVEIDGKRVPDVEAISCYYYKSENDKENKHLDTNITTSTKTDGGMTKRITYYASSDSRFDVISSCDGCVYDDNLPGFVGQKSSDKVIRDIVSYCKTR